MTGPIPNSLPNYDEWKTAPDPEPVEEMALEDLADIRYAEWKERDCDV
jgi:hypothetical protein